MKALLTVTVVEAKLVTYVPCGRPIPVTSCPIAILVALVTTNVVAATAPPLAEVVVAVAVAPELAAVV